MAPEQLTEKYDTKVDVWALGVIMYQMLFGNTPFTGKDEEELTKNLRNGHFSLPESTKLSKETRDFLLVCLQYDPENRFDCTQLLKHDFLRKQFKNLT